MNPRVLIAATLVLVFAAGAAADMAARRIRATTGRDRPTSWAELARTLDLSPAQQQRIDSLFAAHQPKTDALLRELAPRLQALADSIDADLLPLLNPTQRDALARAQTRRLFLIRRKTPQGERVDTITVRPRGQRP